MSSLYDTGRGMEVGEGSGVKEGVACDVHVIVENDARYSRYADLDSAERL